jgi:hypothetical protein
MVIISVFQTDDEGPIPSTRSNNKTHRWCVLLLTIKFVLVRQLVFELGHQSVVQGIHSV